MNIKRSLALQFSLIVATILLIFSFLIYQNSSRFRHSEFIDRLKEKGFILTELLLEESEIDTSFLGTVERNNLNFLQEQKIFVYDSKNQLIYRNSFEIQEPDIKIIKEINLGKEIQYTFGNLEFAGFNFAHRKGKYSVIIGAYDETGIIKLDFLKTLLFQIFFGSLLLTGFLGWFFAKRSLNPMVGVINEVDQITATNLHMRVKTSKNNDEISHLAVTFNEMLNRLESAFLMQKNFVSNASHEFRTPLTSMKGQIEVMLMQNRKEEDYIKTLTSINDDINNLIELLQGLSELAKVNSEFMEEAFEPIDIVDLLFDVRSEILKNKPKYSASIKFENFTEDINKTIIKGNLALIKSAISNLMDNACKFSPDMKVMVAIHFSNDVTIHFIDEGIGISKSEINHVFEPFYRGNDTRNISGHGIGLSLVKKIIELHNGTVKVKSTQGIGTVFTVTLPTFTT